MTVMDGDMTQWGMNGRFEALAGEYPQYEVGRVICQEKGAYTVAHKRGEQSAVVSGKFRHETKTVSDYPAVGDFVMLDTGDGVSAAVIQALLPRKSVFLRKAAGTGNTEQVVAANVDTVFICMSLNKNFNLRRLERYLSVCWDSGAIPVVLLTKADLCDDVEEKAAAARAVAVGTEVLSCSALEKDGWSAVTPYIKEAATLAFVGSSGVGKSTLINRLLGEELLTTNGLRNDDQGRHTTTHRELIKLPGGGLVLDTPGMRELGLWDSAEGVARTFADIEELMRCCRFGNCTHNGEPDCAVCGAIDRGELEPERWQSYLKLKGEEDYANNSESYLAAKKEKFKKIAITNKGAQKKRT